MQHRESSHYKSRLSRKLLLYFFLSSFGFNLLAVAVFIAIDYSAYRNKLDGIFSHIAESHLDALSLAAYNMDDEQLNLIIKGILSSPNVTYVAISEERDQARMIRDMGQSATSGVVTRYFSLRPPVTDADTSSFAKLRIDLTTQGFYRQLRNQSLLALSINTLATFFAMLVIYFVFKHLIARQLLGIADYVRKLNLDWLSTPLVLPRKANQASQDEFDLIVNSINAMRHRLAEDYTQRKQVEDRLDMALIATQSGIWDWDIVNDHIHHVGSLVDTSAGDSANPLDTVASLRSNIHPDDLPALDREIGKHLKNETDFYQCEYRMRHVNGKYMLVFDRGKVVERDQRGRAVRMMGIYSNITEQRQVMDSFQRSEENNKLLLDSSPYAIYQLDFDGKIISMNPAGVAMFSQGENEVSAGKKLFDYIPERDAASVSKATKDAVIDSFSECDHNALNGKTISSLFIPIFDANKTTHLMAMSQDITQRKKDEEAHRKMEDLLTMAQEMAQIGSWEFDVESKEIILSEEMYKIFGIDSVERITSFDQFIDVIHPEDRQRVKESYANSLRMGLEDSNIEYRIIRVHDGDLRYISAKGSHFKNDIGRICKSVGIIQDVTERKRAEQESIYQAHFDALTDLPNRFLTLDRLSQLLVEARRKAEKVAILFFDLDDFKKINDTLGHEMGDKLLIEASRRLKSLVRESDTVGRFGGDEFIIILGGLTDPGDVTKLAEKVVERFRDPFNIDVREMLLTTSLGIAIYPEDGGSVSELLRNADTAMYHAKDSGRNTYSYFTESMNKEVIRRLAIEEQLHGALQRGEFRTVYQPKVDLISKNMIGAEALLRWHNEELGDVSPVEFIPIAEQTGIIVPLGDYVLQEALKIAKKVQLNHEKNFSIAVNLSPRQFRDPNLTQMIKARIEENKIDYASLELEITEGVLLSGHGYIDKAINELSQLGVKISMDDFGTGYSSLSYLRNYPFDILKIDRSFISDIAVDRGDRELVNAAIAMAKSLNLSVIAEGIETHEQLNILCDMGCDLGQGYFLGRPMSPESLMQLF